MEKVVPFWEGAFMQDNEGGRLLGNKCSACGSEKLKEETVKDDCPSCTHDNETDGPPEDINCDDEGYCHTCENSGGIKTTTFTCEDCNHLEDSFIEPLRPDLD